MVVSSSVVLVQNGIFFSSDRLRRLRFEDWQAPFRTIARVRRRQHDLRCFADHGFRRAMNRRHTFESSSESVEGSRGRKEKAQLGNGPLVGNDDRIARY